MSTAICTSCARDLEDCACADCLCLGCITSGCRCLTPPTAVDPLDALVANASVPNLGALYRAAQKDGLIKPVPSYASTT